VSFSANVYILISLTLIWKFIYILDLLHSLYIEPTWLNTRLVAFTSLTSICLVHGTLLKQGLRLQNTLGALKLIVLALIPVSGFLYLAGVKGIQVGDEYEKPNNFTWDSFWEGSGTGPGAFVNGLYNVIWYEPSASGAFCMYFLLTTSSRSFIGYASINSVLSEVRDPVRTIRLAAPLAMISVAAVYFFINISYYAVVSKTDILESQRIVALVTSFYCLVIPFFQLFLQSLIFPESIRSYDRESGFSLLHTASSFVDAVHTIGP
jgi:amino acid transporter